MSMLLLFLSLMPQEKVPYEYSEVVLYEVMVMKEARNYEVALHHMDGLQCSICDVLFLMETKGRIDWVWVDGVCMIFFVCLILIS